MTGRRMTSPAIHHSAHTIPRPSSSTFTASTDSYTLSLHDALPISHRRDSRFPKWRPPGRRPLPEWGRRPNWRRDRKSTRLNSSHVAISYAVFCLKKITVQGPQASVVLQSLTGVDLASIKDYWFSHS